MGNFATLAASGVVILIASAACFLLGRRVGRTAGQTLGTTLGEFFLVVANVENTCHRRTFAPTPPGDDKLNDYLGEGPDLPHGATAPVAREIRARLVPASPRRIISPGCKVAIA